MPGAAYLGLLTDIDHWPEWQPIITAATPEGTLAVGTSFRWETAGLQIRSTIGEVEPTRRLGRSGDTREEEVINRN